MSCNGTWSIEVAGLDLAVGQKLVINGNGPSGIPTENPTGSWGTGYLDASGDVTYNSAQYHLVIESGKLNCYSGHGEGAVWTAQGG